MPSPAICAPDAIKNSLKIQNPCKITPSKIAPPVHRQPVHRLQSARPMRRSAHLSSFPNCTCCTWGQVHTVRQRAKRLTNGAPTRSLPTSKTDIPHREGRYACSRETHLAATFRASELWVISRGSAGII